MKRARIGTKLDFSHSNTLRHGTKEGFEAGCQCHHCRQAGFPHSYSRYVAADLRCRCMVCKAAAARAQKRVRERRKARLEAGEEISTPHGRARYEAGCRCDVCKQATYSYVSSRKQRLRALAEHTQGRSVPHGTRKGYGEHGCRCFECAEAWRKYRAGLRDREPRPERFCEVCADTIPEWVFALQKTCSEQCRETKTRRDRRNRYRAQRQ